MTHLGKGFFGGDAAVHDPDALGFAILGFDFFEEVGEGGVVGGIAGEHFVGDGEAVRGDDEGDDDLDAVAALVATVSKAADVFGVLWRVTLEVGAGEIIEEDFEFGLKEGAPAFSEVVEEGGFVREDFVVALVEAVDFSEGKVGAQEVAEGTLVKPVPVEPPLAAGVNESVEDEGLEDLIPACALATRGKFFAPKFAKSELLPEVAGKPACSPLPRAFEAHFGEAHSDVGKV